VYWTLDLRRNTTATPRFIDARRDSIIIFFLDRAGQPYKPMQTITPLYISEVRPGKERNVTLFLAILLLGCVTFGGAGCQCVNPGAVDAWEAMNHQPYYSYYADRPDFAFAVSGPWAYNDCRTNISIAPDGRTLIITDESGQRNSGYVAGNREIIVPAQAIRGHIGYGALHITWSNGTVWARPSRLWYAVIFP
jgi:hypothetical protein